MSVENLLMFFQGVVMKVGAQAQVPQGAVFDKPLAVFGYVNQLVQQEIAAAMRDEDRREAAVVVANDRRVPVAA